MRWLLLIPALLSLAVLGCGVSPGKVKGQLVMNGQPLSFSGQTAIMFTLLDESGNPDNTKAFTGVVNAADGTFEVLASGGLLPPGNYHVSLEGPGAGGVKYKRFVGASSPIRREVKSGDNDFTIELANPNS